MGELNKVIGTKMWAGCGDPLGVGNLVITPIDLKEEGQGEK